MAENADAVPHRLVHVRGGPLMLFTALCISLPSDAQHLLPVLLWLIPSLVFLKVPQLATAVVRRVVEPLFFTAVSEVTNSHHAVSKWRAGLHSSQLLSKATQLLVTYLAGRRVAKLVTSSPPSAKHRAPADHLASLSDVALCRRVLSVVAQSVPAQSPASLRSLPDAARGRVCASLFATTTPIALTSLLQHVLAHSANEPVTLYVPGLLTAPWTTHLAPVLRRVQRQHGTRVVGYDISVEAQCYAVDLKHLRGLADAHHHHHHPASTSPTARAALAASSAVLILASLRGRGVQNRDEAFEFAKARGWLMVELAVPTFPADAVNTVGPHGFAQVPHTHSVHSTSMASSLSVPDVHITAFDDVGMYGGAAVHLCVSDRALLTHMVSECQIGIADTCTATDSPAAAPVGIVGAAMAPARNSMRGKAAALRALPSTALTTTTDFTSRSSEYLTHVWLPWSGRLYHALRDEGAALLPMAQRVQQNLAASQKFLTHTLPSLSVAVPQKVARLLSGRTAQSETQAPTPMNDATADAAGSELATDGRRITAATTVEQRTVVIQHPLPPLDLVPALTSTPETVTTPAGKAEEGTEPRSTPSLAAEGGALTSWLSRLPKAEAAAAVAETEVVRNTAAEWRIRLRWTALLLATYSDGITDDASAATRLPRRNDVCVAAYVSLWSFVAQLPPWVCAVSAAGGEDVGGSGGGGGVETAATALLVHVVQPASARAVAQLLCDEAAVDARAVSLRTWEEKDENASSSGVASSPAASKARGFEYEDGLVMPGCARAAALVGELLYIPLSPAMGTKVREGVLRVLWEKVPHAGHTVQRQSAPPSRDSRRLRELYRTYLSSNPVPSGAEGSSKRLGEAFRFRPLQLGNDGADVSALDVERAQQAILCGAHTMAAAAVAPPSFVTDAATSLVAPMKNTVMDKVLSKL